MDHRGEIDPAELVAGADLERLDEAPDVRPVRPAGLLEALPLEPDLVPRDLAQDIDTRTQAG